jgi:hypothetical protein
MMPMSDEQIAEIRRRVADRNVSPREGRYDLALANTG